MVIGAHIHYPFERAVGGRQVVVVGAVGCPFNGDINAQYGLFHLGRRELALRASLHALRPPAAVCRLARRRLSRDGSLASELMMLEHQTARTHYVPFWEWCLAQDLGSRVRI